MDPLAALFRDQGFVPVPAGALGGAQSRTGGAATRHARCGPAIAIGVSLLSGDLQLGATGTVTEVDGSRVYAFGHPFYGLGPTQFPMTRAHVHGGAPQPRDLDEDGDDRRRDRHGAAGSGDDDRRHARRRPSADSADADAEVGAGHAQDLHHGDGQRSAPDAPPDVLRHLRHADVLRASERRGELRDSRHARPSRSTGTLSFEDLFSGDQPSAAASAYIVGPINFLLRNAFEDVDLEAVNLEVDASEQPRSATLERAWIDGTRPKAGSTVNLKVLLRTYRGEQVTSSVPVQIPPNARGSVSMMVTDGVRLSQWEARELQVQPAQTRGLPQMMRVLNNARKNNRLYVRLVTRDGGAVVKGESLAALPPSVLAVLESDRDGGNFRPLQIGPARRMGDHDRLRRRRIAHADDSASGIGSTSKATLTPAARRDRRPTHIAYASLPPFRVTAALVVGCATALHAALADVLAGVDGERVPQRRIREPVD